eukprot:scaffold2703_cov129-Isochrysis_galbana.AAC.9
MDGSLLPLGTPWGLVSPCFCGVRVVDSLFVGWHGMACAARPLHLDSISRWRHKRRLTHRRTLFSPFSGLPKVYREG